MIPERDGAARPCRALRHVYDGPIGPRRWNAQNGCVIRRPSPAAFVAAAVASLATPAAVAAHGVVPAEEPTAATLLLGWSVEPLVALPLAAAVAGWFTLVGRVNRAHPLNPVPRRRTAVFLGGLAAIAIALLSGIGRYDTALFSVHMVQHVLLAFVAAPLIVLSAPITLVLRAATPVTRRRWILPLLHSRLVRVLAFPVVAWLAFAATMWGSHYSPLFNAALEHESLHWLEHLLFVTVALMFWWQVIAADPTPWRMAHPIRVLYVFLQMPQGTFLSLAILSASAPLYPHYATLSLPWLPDALADQGVAGGIMWLVGDLVFLAAILAIIAGWVRREERETARADARADAARATIREREAMLAERLAEERGAE